MSKSLKNISVVAGATVISRVLGMVRDQVAAAVLGGSVFNDAFLTAFSLPNLFRRLLGEGSLTAAFVPTLQEELRDGGDAAAFALLNQVTSWLAVVCGALVALAMLAFGQSRLLPGQEDKWYLAADLTVIMFPYLLFISLAASFNATLNVMHRFTEPALSPIWLNVAMIASLGGAGLHYASTPLGEVHWLCAGVLIGGFFQMTVPAAVLIRIGWRPRFALQLPPGVRQIARLMLPGLLGTAIYQINIFVSRILAFSLPVSAATMMFYANRLMELPIGVFAIAVATVVYPLIARHASQGDMKAMGRDFHRGLRLILAINVPAAAGLALLSEPIVRLLYQRGEFTAANTALMAPLLTLFVVGMPLFSISSLTVRAFYSIKDTKTPVRIAVIDFVVNLILSLVLKRVLGAYGLVLASTTAILVQTVLLQIALARRLPELAFRPLWGTVLKIVVATSAMALLVWFGWRELQGLGFGRRADLFAVVGLIPLGVAAYGAALWMLRIEGREELWAIVMRRPLKPEL